MRIPCINRTKLFTAAQRQACCWARATLLLRKGKVLLRSGKYFRNIVRVYYKHLSSTYQDKKELPIAYRTADTHRNGKIVRSVRHYITDAQAVCSYRRTLADKNRLKQIRNLLGIFWGLHTIFQHFLNNITFFFISFAERNYLYHFNNFIT